MIQFIVGLILGFMAGLTVVTWWFADAAKDQQNSAEKFDGK